MEISEETFRRLDAFVKASKNGFGHEGKLSEQRYKVELSHEYGELYREARFARRSFAYQIGRNCMLNFPTIISQLDEIDLNNASGADIGTLIRYFSYRDKTLEEITDSMRWERI